jgi:nucleotide-binding universal stress UspA family protein
VVVKAVKAAACDVFDPRTHRPVWHGEAKKALSQAGMQRSQAPSAALPLLKQARRVILLSIAEEGETQPREALQHLARGLAWHGIAADVQVEDEGPGPAAARLSQFTRALGADLMVVGAFGHKPLREHVFGGVTQTVIEHAEVPVLMMR